MLVKLFLLTNTSYKLIRSACEYLLEDVVKELGLKDWHAIFDWIIVQAKKPSWFNVPNRPFREFDLNTEQFVLSHVKEMKKNRVYFGGCLNEFNQMTGLQSHEVLYFGDNVTSDLTGPFKAGQWKTCGIVRELEKEVSVNNNPVFVSMLLQILDIENLLHDAQHLKDPNSMAILNSLREARHDLRDKMKRIYNTQFGSIFRTHSTRTLYFHFLARYSDLYTSRVTNMLQYDMGHCFQPRRSFYDHEPNYWMPDAADHSL
ncbi:hypothetical protein RFI_23434 [Reticulomyxa filosa]|uniref:Uncharacterized protein n=1 Tax=Reticulomyxa filosa TaxID=46433 RepID=X6MKH0_RETFI|nr:hypothetical protein RFI_23434 [Reticulomyxa filosa]|eukprot:ETO13932.1 hypothetical protein RFI_23434 [Reticulomyxa filosa]